MTGHSASPHPPLRQPQAYSCTHHFFFKLSSATHSTRAGSTPCPLATDLRTKETLKTRPSTSLALHLSTFLRRQEQAYFHLFHSLFTLSFLAHHAAAVSVQSGPPTYLRMKHNSSKIKHVSRSTVFSRPPAPTVRLHELSFFSFLSSL